MSDETPPPAQSDATRLDVVIIGAGLGGLRLLHEFRQKSSTVIALEAAPDLGGTWYWNRYPGARTDSESWTYAYSFSQELQDGWNWSERFPTQDEVHRYLSHAADLFGWRDHISFDTEVASAVFEEPESTWLVTTTNGRRFRCTYLITALGLLSRPYTPHFEGIESFAGEWHVTGRWPQEGVEFAGKRVAVIGTGATAVQAIPLIAQVAEHVTVFQRTPNFVLPARNYALTDLERQRIRETYAEIWKSTRRHPLGYAFDRAGLTRSDVDATEHERILQRGWEAGGFRFLYETFDDITTDEKANSIASEFVRTKIRAIVKDPATADLLCPQDYPIASKRPPLGHFYYEAFNRENVSLVDISQHPISRITPEGVAVGDELYAADIIVFATGFDAGTGSYDRIDIRGRDGLTLKKHWAEGPRTHLGITVDGFPNMFMVSGPQSPFGNIPVVVQVASEWISHAVDFLQAHKLSAIEPTEVTVDAWRQRLHDYLDMTVLDQGRNSWLLGANIPGKPREVLFFFGGVGTYIKACRAAEENSYADFTLAGRPATISS